MNYPEKGASYRNKPAWMDRAAAGEKRAQGGAVPDYRGDGEDAGRILEDQMHGARQEKTYSPESGKHFWDSGTKIPGKQKGENDRYMERRGRTTSWDGDYRHRPQTDVPVKATPGASPLSRAAETGAEKGPNSFSRGGRTRKRADGGGMAPPGMKPTDPTITKEDVKTWGTADNARAAARAREHAAKNPYAKGDDAQKQMMGRGIGQSIGFKRGGRA